MQMRHDAGWVAGEITSFVRRLANEIGGNQVGTVGKIDLVPNLVNVVASRATLTADLRNTDDERLKEAELRLTNFCDDLSEQEEVRITSEVLARFEPVKFDNSLVREVINFSKSLNLSVKSMTSGAGHDAQMFARICPAAMIFVPSKNGLSHNPDEFTSQEEIENGANVLLQMMIQLAGLNHG
jgi:N-carbamoyl-L-amino-acid hydrolase